MITSKIQRLDWYWAHLEQDWCICQVVNIEDDTITVNFHGMLYSYGKPEYEEDVPIEHFKAAYKRSVDGDWSRECHPDTFDGIFYEKKLEEAA